MLYVSSMETTQQTLEHLWKRVSHRWLDNFSDELRRASASSRAEGSVALLGSPSTPRFGPTFRTLWCCCLHENPTAFTFVLADGRGDSIDIEIMGPTDSLSELMEILDD